MLSRKSVDYVKFEIYTGYVESQSLTPVIFYRDIHYNDLSTFSTWQKAWEESFGTLRRTIVFSAYKKYYNAEPAKNACCRDAAKNKNNVFCPICGKHIIANIPLKNLSEEEKEIMVMDYLSSLNNLTVDDYEGYEILEQNGWILYPEFRNSYNDDKKFVTTIINSGEQLISNYKENKNPKRHFWSKNKNFWEAVTIREFCSEEILCNNE